MGTCVSGETEREQSGWTTDTLNYHVTQQLNDMRVLLDERFLAQQRSIAAALLATEKAIGKAEIANEKRFESVNEFRGQLNDQTRTFLSRTEVDAMHKTSDAAIDRNSDRVNELATRLDKIEGRGSGVSQAYIYAFALIAALGTLVSIYVAVKRH